MHSRGKSLLKSLVRFSINSTNISSNLQNFMLERSGGIICNSNARYLPAIVRAAEGKPFGTVPQSNTQLQKGIQ